MFDFIKSFASVCLALRVPLVTALLATGVDAFAGEMEAVRPLATIQFSKSASFRISTYIQARAEYGDLAQGSERDIQPSDFDLYFRRARIGFHGTALTPGLSYGLSFAGDESVQSEIYSSYDGRGNVVLSDVYLRYAFSDQLVLKFGKDKLPYSRVYLTSSSEQLLSERPYYTYALRDFFHTYTHSHVGMSGDIRAGGLLAYSVAVGRAWRSGDSLRGDSGPVVTSAPPMLVARMDWSPAGWEERRRSDAHVGQGQHFGVGAYGAAQNSLRYRDGVVEASENRRVHGVDVSFHQGASTFQAEYNAWRTGGSILESSRRAASVYVQGAYLFQGLMLEPAIRLERYKQKTESGEGRAQVVTVGANKYVQGQDLKFTLDIEQTSFDGEIRLLRPKEKDKRRVLRLTAQFVL